MIAIPFFRLGPMLEFDRKDGIPATAISYIQGIKRPQERARKWKAFGDVYAGRSPDILKFGTFTRNEISRWFAALTTLGQA